MNEKNKKMRHVVFIMAMMALTSLIITGCATFTRETATVNISKGEKAISVARESDARVNAPAELALADDKLAASKAALEKNDYESATRLAEQATIDADYARVKAISDKDAKAAELSKENIKTLQKEVDRVPK